MLDLGLSGQCAQLPVEEEYSLELGVMEIRYINSNKAATFHLVLVGQLGPHAVQHVVMLREQEKVAPERLMLNDVLRGLVSPGHPGHRAVLLVDLDIRLGLALMMRWNGDPVLLDLVVKENLY